MIFLNTKIQTRKHLPIKPHKLKPTLKMKECQSDTDGSGKPDLEMMKLTSSNNMGSGFTVNLIAPHPENPEVNGNKFASPGWIIASDTKLLSSVGSSSQNQLASQCLTESTASKGILQGSAISQVYETDVKQKKLVSLNCQKLERIPQILQEENKENKNEPITSAKSIYCQDIQHKSAYMLEQVSSQSQKDITSSFNCNSKIKSTLTYRCPKSTNILKQKLKKLSPNKLDALYNEQFEKLSEYGLKPCQAHRLKKIQNLEKQELILERYQEQIESLEQIKELNRTQTNKVQKIRKGSEKIEHRPYFNIENIEKTAQNANSKIKSSKSKQKVLSLSKNKNALNSHVNLKKVQGKKN